VSDTFQIPSMLPNGMVLYQDVDLMRRLHYGDATYGWVGDERLGVYHANGRIEIWRHCEDGEPRLICRSKPGLSVLDGGLIRFLAEHDSRSRRAYDAKADMDAHNARLQAEREAELAEACEEHADHFHWALMRDIGAQEGGATKRLHTLPEAPWKRPDAVQE
jgi:hypothetical protein